MKPSRSRRCKKTLLSYIVPGSLMVLTGYRVHTPRLLQPYPGLRCQIFDTFIDFHNIVSTGNLKLSQAIMIRMPDTGLVCVRTNHLHPTS